MNQKNEHKDNIIIALSVALVVAVLCCAVLGVIVGIGGDINSSSEVALAYHSSDDAPASILTRTWSGSYIDYLDFNLSSQVLNTYIMPFDDVCSILNIDSDSKIPVYYDITFSLSFEDTYDQYSGTVEIGTFSQMNSMSSHIIDSFSVSGGAYLTNIRLICYSDEIYIQFVNDGFTFMPPVIPEIEIEITRISVSYFDIQHIYDEAYDEGYDFGYENGEADGYQIGYDEGTVDGAEQGYSQGYDEGIVDGAEQGYSQGYDEGYDSGFTVGKNTGFNEGVQQAGDYTFFSLITSVFDAPLRVILGQWVDVDGDGVLDELSGGFLNFYVPVLDIDLAPLIISLFTVCIIIIVIRFVLARL